MNTNGSRGGGLIYCLTLQQNTGKSDIKSFALTLVQKATAASDLTYTVWTPIIR